MKTLLITNIREGKGLYRDALIVKGLLEEWGHQAEMLDFRQGTSDVYDLVIHLEVADAQYFRNGACHWWIPNPEWVTPTYLKHVDGFDAILCKTQDAARLLSPHSDRLVFTGFMSEDRRDSLVQRARIFFHARKGSMNKGTQAIRAAWADEDFDWPLIIAHDLTEATVRHQQNHAWFHLCPSEYEGWGHTIHEALSVGAIVVVTDIPPLNEIEGVAYCIPPGETWTRRLATIGLVDKEGVRQAVDWCLGLSPRQITRYSRAARKAYEKESQGFRERLGELLRSVE